ncbi:MAG TPA: type 1 glutamine amidotransferase [Nitrosopumilaceae archaeon]|nr:type 1 glutamine amidotransferase [Nitrosopumilaceae archaeon]
MADVLVIQNSKIEGIGTLGNLLESDGYRLQTIYAKQQQIPEGDFSLLVILGASESANDNLPYLIEEQKLIRKFVTNKIPVLGICLGSQLIAKALGAKVYTGHKKEIGFYDDLTLDGNSKLFSGVTSPMTVFHWHGDTFSLPDKSVRLAHSQNYENQAFQMESAIGVQFHLEVDKAIVNLWLDKAQEKLKDISYVNPNKIRKEVDEKIPIVQNNMEIFYKNFKSTFHF